MGKRPTVRGPAMNPVDHPTWGFFPIRFKHLLHCLILRDETVPHFGIFWVVVTRLAPLPKSPPPTPCPLDVWLKPSALSTSWCQASCDIRSTRASLRSSPSWAQPRPAGVAPLASPVRWLPSRATPPAPPAPWLFLERQSPTDNLDAPFCLPFSRSVGQRL
ncbi:hypothetical protein L7F22_024967, partial [Adiantum nelumboides]|nr:hypothetical protein [Adiantum nelumboides]